ncbi:MAG: metal-dependent phosphohydrolase [Desulfovibrionaceae bacterium]|nr:metal-dependent phosphohydrolase [Desulfovibrionaceae bacterium]
MERHFDRRQFLELGAAFGAVLAAQAVFPALAKAAPSQKSLADCQAMTPVQMADASPHVTASWTYLRDVAGTIRDPQVRSTVLAILDNPAPTLAARLADAKNRAAVCEELAAKGYVKDATPETLLPPLAADPAAALQPFRSAPGSGYQSHHSYPGGLATHTACNMKISLSIFDTYRDVYGFDLDRDAVVVSQMLHDLHKPWVFAWGESGESRPEKPLAGTGEHHALSVAESMVRGLPPAMVVAQACAHNHPGSPKDEAEVVGWIKAAAILAGVDPVEKGFLARGGETLPEPRRMEGFVCHLGDHDWVLSVPSAKWTIPVLAEIARERYGMSETDLAGKPFNAFRNYIYSQTTAMRLYAASSTQGKAGVAALAEELVKPV